MSQDTGRNEESPNNERGNWPVLSQNSVSSTSEDDEHWFHQVDPDGKLTSCDHIRLLGIPSSSNGILDCLLVEGPLRVVIEPESRFYALSYCWGDELAEDDIFINGKPLRVTQNLYKALEAISCSTIEPTETDSSSRSLKWLWVDAICINQNDNAEKSSQVQRMDQIYRGATMVLIWLGDEAGNSAMVMAFLRALRALDRLTAALMAQCDQVYIASLEQNFSQSAAMLSQSDMSEDNVRVFYDFCRGTADRELGVAVEWHQWQVNMIIEFRARPGWLHPDHPFWPAFLAIMARPWFRRVWTFQEIVLSSEATVICGRDAVEWETFNSCRTQYFSLLWLDFLFDAESITKAGVGDELIRASMNREFTRDYGNGATVQDFLYLLGHSAGRQAKDPRDYIYGLLGILDESLRPGPKPDYSMSACEVFVSTTQVLTQHPGGVGFWCHLLEEFSHPNQNNDYGLPSWCPDYTSKARQIAGPRLGTHWECMDEKVAAELHVSTAEVQCNLTTMRLPVVFLDNVYIAADIPAPPLPEVLFFTRSKLDWELEHEHSPSVQLIIGESFQTWHQQMLKLFNVETSDSRTIFVKWLREFFFVHTKRPTLLQSDDNLISKFENLEKEQFWKYWREVEESESEPSSVLGEVLHDAVRAIALNRGLHYFLTRQDRIGFSAAPSRPGDRLCYIPGGNMLQILAPGADRYITTACVREFMGDSLLEMEREWTYIELH